ncbi:Probable LRR receptor-like serine/threonine-protein kinase At3g47570 [Linum grandiflorum]
MSTNSSNPLSPVSSIFIINLILLLSAFTHHPSASANNETDRLALLEFSKAISSDPRGVLHSWNGSTHFCNWVGVSCNLQQRVTSLVLNQLDLSGTLSPYIGNLTFLKAINLENNTFRGQIPQQIGKLVHLQELNLTWNAFAGEIPDNLTRCSQLRILRLGSSFLRGTIPEEIGSLSRIEYIRFQKNNLTGRIPPSLGNLSRLIDFGAAYNNLVGSIPETLGGGLQSLFSISLGINQMTGKIPRSFSNITSLNIIAIPWNQFEGVLPVDMGYTLPNLQKFAISKNRFSGTLPESFCNATQLQMLDMNDNSFTGRIPSCLGNSPRLNRLSTAFNRLGHNSTGDLDFLTGLQNATQMELLVIKGNNFGGTFPNSVANLSVQLTKLDVSLNQIRGVIPFPAGLEKFVNLDFMDLSYNLLQGSIPSYFTKLRNLRSLHLAGNQLSGQIPPSIGNLTQLLELDMSSNRLEGAVPSSIGSCTKLIYLDISSNNLGGTLPQEVFNLPSLTKSFDLSHNLFNGSLPPDVGKLSNLNALDISHNLLSGEIPNDVGNCKSLEYLYLQGNSFNGSIPPSLASLKGLSELDLSHNELRGPIVRDLQSNNLLQYLNLSFNQLEGEVPKGGIFSNATGILLMGNTMLCGGVSELQLPKCPAKQGKHNIKYQPIVLTIVAVLVAISLLSFLAFQLMKRSKKRAAVEEPTLPSFTRVSYRDLYKATDGFSTENLIGSGSFGTVYKGKLDENNNTPVAVVAVKVLNLQHRKANKSLAAECNALKQIRHRNLVRVVSYCSSLDHKGEEFKALVFEYMRNGSLEQWLHPGSQNLSLVQRLNIAIDVASALHYLHELCKTPIVHHDLKPGNVLIDDEMVGHVSDFGLATFLSGTHSNMSTVGVEGTIGYAAPEYGMGSAASKEGDMYSFGILILEMFSGRRPTHEMFKDGLNLHNYIKDALPSNLCSVTDPILVLPRLVVPEASTSQLNEISEQLTYHRNFAPEKVNQCLASVLDIGVGCSAESPQQRMKIADVLGKLHHIRDDFLRNSIRVRTNQAL